MRRLGLRASDSLWSSIRWYGEVAGLVGNDGRIDISETVRDLLARGLVTDRSHEAGYRNGYNAGRVAGFAEVMRRFAAASSTLSASPRSGRGLP